MRIPVICTDVERYVENPRRFLPERAVCPNNPAHKPTWHGCWKRGLLSDHVRAGNIPVYRSYCEPCRETISYWPMFVLPYQREPLETLEGALVEHLGGSSTREIAGETGYDPRTVSRWIKLTLNQSLSIFYQVIRRILLLIGTEWTDTIKTHTLDNNLSQGDGANGKKQVLRRIQARSAANM